MLRKIGDIALAFGTIVAFAIWAWYTLRGAFNGTAHDPRTLVVILVVVGAAALFIVASVVVRRFKSHKRS